MGKKRRVSSSLERSRYAMYDFIGAVQAQNVIWQRDHKDYHNREKREVAWRAVARNLNKNFDEYTDEDKRRTVTLMTRRWKNTRDCFFRTFRSSCKKRSYIYEQQLAFLLPNKRSKQLPWSQNDAFDDDDEDAFDQHETWDEPSNQTFEDVDQKPTMEELENTLKGTKPIEEHQWFRALSPHSEASITSDPIQILKDIGMSCNDDRTSSPQSQCNRNSAEEQPSDDTFQEATATPAMEIATTLQRTSNLPSPVHTDPDPDQAFFDSIKPVMRTMDIDQKLNFQIEVLQLLKKFKRPLGKIQNGKVKK